MSPSPPLRRTFPPPRRAARRPSWRFTIGNSDPTATADALPDLLSDGDDASADEGEGSDVGSDDGPPGLAGACGSDCDDGDDEPLGGIGDSSGDAGAGVGVVVNGDGPRGISDDDRSDDSNSEDEPSQGRVWPLVVWQLDVVQYETARANLLPPLDYGSGDEVFYGSRGEVFVSRGARRRASVAALFPVDVDSDGDLRLDFDDDVLDRLVDRLDPNVGLATVAASLAILVQHAE
jgi:hypothetical protein